MRTKIVFVIAVTVAAAAAITIFVFRLQHESVTLTGVVVKQDSDPHKQTAVPNVKIAATYDEHRIETVSQSSGFFQLQLIKDVLHKRPLTLTLRHPDYEPVTAELLVKSDLLVVRMSPVSSPPPTNDNGTTPIKNVRIRYTEKTPDTINIGSAVRTFEVPNEGNAPCGGKPPCSPDGKWKAASGGLTMDAGEGQQFTHMRVSCIAGPCPFTAITSGTTTGPARIVKVEVRNWSDTATFLVEAEVARNTPTNAERVAYPAIYGRTMSFTLPGTGQGPSIEADLGDSRIVFPLGPELILSWANCVLQVSADQTKLYRCELKAGYEFE